MVSVFVLHSLCNDLVNMVYDTKQRVVLKEQHTQKSP
jgi:hypothetical protein